MKEMNFESIGKLIDSTTKKLVGADGKTNGKEREWMILFSIIAIASAVLPFAKVTTILTGSISFSLLDLIFAEGWNILFLIPQIIILILIAKKVRYSDIIIPAIVGIEFWMYVFYAVEMGKDNNEYAKASVGIGYWLIIGSLIGINWMADKLGMGIWSYAKRLFGKVILLITRNVEHQPTNASVHPVTNETTRCNECGTALSDNAKFCSGCGTVVVAKEKGNFCSDCGNEYQEGVAFCRECGAKLN